MKNLIIVVSAVFVLSITMSATLQSGECDELKKENEKLKLELIASQKLADAAALEARKQAAIAQEQRLMAEKAQQEVMMQRKLAEEAAERARENYRKAEAMLADAIRQAEIARQKKQAEDSVKKKN